MTGASVALLAAPVLAVVILLWITVEDLRRYRIRNIAVLALAACFVIDCVLRDRPVLLLWHGALAGGVFILTAGAFAVGWMGGGDAKLLPAALFWVGPEGAVLFALILFCATILYGVGALAGVVPSRRVEGRRAIPFGPSIACAAIVTIALSLPL